MKHKLNRRQFIHLGTALASAGICNADERQNQLTYHEATRDIPIVERADVVVCGAGPAGVAAAMAAARCGAKTRLIEVNGCLGGIWTAGLLCWILDTKDKPGLLVEIMSRILEKQAGYVNKPGYSFAYDVEVMKWLLEQMCVEAGVRIQLHTRVVAAARDKQDRFNLAITESKSGRQAWAGKVFIDATGDGDLAALAGCGFDLGRPKDGKTQPMSMMAILAGVQFEQIKEFVRGTEKNSNVPKLKLLAELRKAGVDSSYGKPTLFRIHDDLFCLAANHEYDVLPTSAANLTEATMRARAEINSLVNALRRVGGVWKNLRLVATNEHIGVREGRRIHGLYTVSAEDLKQGLRHKDSICRVYFGVDVHSVSESEGKGITRTGVRSRAYDIPLRSLIAKDVNGLMMAGRCISGDFIAHSSYRVTGNAVALGQAAGLTAALAAKTHCLPQDVPWEQIKTTLTRFDMDTLE
ncbi:MAG: FAD-dependent oxidoreductase [Sedimentisphaerales bacterium]|nr:FAD-dependent oxidoreductase [Sedimentisphaerales bacterium]